MDLKIRKAVYSRAGHCPAPYYNSLKDTIKFFKDVGIGLGIVRDEGFSKYINVNELNYHANDVLVLYTDGIIEARNSKLDEEFGYERLEKCLDKYKSLSAEEIKEAIFKDLKEFIKEGTKVDDMTLVVIKFK